MYFNFLVKYSAGKNPSLTAFLQDFGQTFCMHYFLPCVSVCVISEFNTSTIRGAPKIFLCGGKGAVPEVIYIYILWFILKKYLMKITSKSPGRHLVRLQKKLKQTEKKILHILTFYYIFPSPMY
jgi:hypothetical protein